MSQSLTAGKKLPLNVTDSHPNLSYSKKMQSPKVLHASFGSSAAMKNPDTVGSGKLQDSRTNLTSAANKQGFRKLIMMHGVNSNQSSIA